MKSGTFISGMLLMASVASLCPGLDETPLQAGAAAVEISPQKLPALLNGGFLQQTARQILDPLHARTLVLSSDQETLAIVIVDSCMFPRTLCDEIKQLAASQTGIPVNRILISATHTHSAPSAMSMCLGCDEDRSYVEFVTGRVARSIADAKANLQPAKLGWVVVDGSEFTHCRRWITRSDRMGVDPFGDRTVRAMMHPGYQNPNYTSPAGPIDPWLSVVSVVSARDETPICVLANLSMHYFGGGAFSADYFGEVARLLEARVPKANDQSTTKFVGILSQGTSGDLHWMDYAQPRQAISRQQYAEKVASRIMEAWEKIEHQENLSLAMAERRMTLDRRVPSRGRREWARPINAARGDLPPRNQTEVYAQQAEWIHQNPKVEMVLQAVRIGSLGLTAMPTETYGITGLKLKRQSPLAATINFELANGAAGYIPPPEQHRLGGYTTWPARTAGLEENAEPVIVETLLGLLESVATKRRRPLIPPTHDYSRSVLQQKPFAYWRLEDMDATTVRDELGKLPAKYSGGVALFLPGLEGPGFTSSVHGNRAVYLAGGHVETTLEKPIDSYSLTFWFRNALPTNARGTTGLLFANDSFSLRIAGTQSEFQNGQLLLQSGAQTVAGKTPVSTGHWQHVSIIVDRQQVRVYLDGREEPEIDFMVSGKRPASQFLLGSDGRSSDSLDGNLDEVALFDRVLSTDDVAALYRASGMTPPPRPKPTVILGPKPTDAASRRKYGEAVMDSHPIAFWRLHDQSDQSARDATGKHPAQYEGDAAPLSKGSTQRNFAGGRVKAQTAQLGNTYSVELWFRNDLPVDSRPVTAYLFSRAVDGVDGADGDNLGIGGTHSHAGQLIVFNGNTQDQLAFGPTRIPAGSWAHVVLVRNNQQITVYLNGDPEPEISASLPVAYPDGCQQLFLGGRADRFANLQGFLEEVAVYDRVLTPQEVASHFQAASVQPIEQAQPVPKAAAEEPTPLDGKQALRTIHVPDGFEVQLVAAEPLVADPVAIDWGPDGKLWVVEMADYPLGMDGQGKPGGRVRFLEDTDRDGKYDRSTLFAEGLSFPTGVLAWEKGVLVTAAPEILYLEDLTGDGKADVRRVLYSGFLQGNQQLRVNGLRLGLDNWVYCASGSHHGGYGKESQILSHLTGTRTQIGSRDFRIRPDTGAIDPQSGPSQFGRNRDDWGNWFGVQNSHPLWHYVLADHQIRRNPHFAPPDPKHQVVTPSNPPVYPASKLQKRFHSFEQSGRFTSACSAMIYRDSYLFERNADRHSFTCEPFHNLVQHNLISEDGVSFTFRRAAGEEKMDFFASEDRWCRPVMVRTGPDGALWVVDMYRYMIEHPEWLPQNGKDELRPWYRTGEDRGRIYRVVRSGLPARNLPRLSGLPWNKLVERLESSNGWERDLAQRLLIQGRNLAAVDQLTSMATSSSEPLGRLHALWTLEGLGQLSASTLATALQDRHAGVRRNAVQIAAQVVVDESVLTAVADDPDAKVRLELATTLGYYDGDQAAEALAKLAIRSAGDRYQRAAVMGSLNSQNVSKVLAKVIQSGSQLSDEVTSELISQAVAMGGKEVVNQVVQLVCQQHDHSLELPRLASLARLLDGLENRKWSLDRLSDAARDTIKHSVDQAGAVAGNEEAAADLRAAAVGLLGRIEDRLDRDLVQLRELLVPQSPVIVQRAIVSSLIRRSEPAVADLLLSGWRSHSPEIRQQILEGLASRQSWTEALRKELESGNILASEINASIRQRLLASGGNPEAWQKAFAGKVSTNRADILRHFQPALKLPGNSARGKAIFHKACISCHKLKDEGHEVGPQLGSITDKSVEALWNSILDPSSAVDAKYFNYTVSTLDGRSYAGLLETETASSITLLAAGGKRQKILRRDIEELQASRKSVMPDGLEQELNPQDLADLIQFVRDAFR